MGQIVFVPREIEANEPRVAASPDTVKRIAALGFEPEDLPGTLDAGLGVTRSRTLAIDPKRFTTSLEGVFAAGDIRVKELRQVVTATGDGSIAAEQAQKYIEELAEEKVK